MIARLSSSFRFRCAIFGFDDRRIKNCSMRLAFHLEHSWRIRKSAGRLIVRPLNRTQKQESVPEGKFLGEVSQMQHARTASHDL